MTGNGTQSSPYIVENWEDLKTACDTTFDDRLNAYVQCVEGLEIDLKGVSDTLKLGVYLKLYGNNAVIKNAESIDIYIKYGETRYGPEVHNLNFLKCKCDPLKAFINDPFGGGIKFFNCTIEISGGYAFIGYNVVEMYFEKCCIIYESQNGFFMPIQVPKTKVSQSTIHVDCKTLQWVSDGGSFHDRLWLDESYLCGYIWDEKSRYISVGKTSGHCIFELRSREKFHVNVAQGYTAVDVINTELDVNFYPYQNVFIPLNSVSIRDATRLYELGFDIAISESDGAHHTWEMRGGRPQPTDAPDYGTSCVEVIIPDVEEVEEENYIIIFDRYTKQNEFDTHGLAILSPTKCEITEEFNGSWSLSLEHPIDELGKWQHIQQYNIIKALGQLFVIKIVTEDWSGSTGKISASADHIFYHQNDWWIPPGSYICAPSIYHLVRIAHSKAEKIPFQKSVVYEYEYHSNLYISSYLGQYKWYDTKDGMTLIDLIMGSGNILEISGGELYRDNFYYSIYAKMENSKEDAFELRVGLNLKGIKRTVDVSTVCTYFTGYCQNNGAELAVSWSDDTMNIFPEFPHSVVRSKKFSYSFKDPGISYEIEARMIDEQFDVDVLNFFGEYCSPLISYEVSLEDVENSNPDFAELKNKPEYKVGNTGYVYDERLGANIKLRITKTVKDAITGKTISVMFGKNRSFVSSGYKSAFVDAKPVIHNNFVKITDSEGKILKDSEGKQLIQYIK